MKSPYLTAAEAADYLRYTNVAAFRAAARRRRVPSLLRGRGHLYLEADLIACWQNTAAVNLRIQRKRLA